MSVGTIVTIVLIVAFLIVGIYFISKIRETGENAIEGINSQIMNKINSLFAEDSTKKIIVYPPTRQIKIKKGTDNLGFGFAIRNIENEQISFSYRVSAEETDCGMILTDAEDLISLGKKENNLMIPPATVMDDPVFVRFNIPESAPSCSIRYYVNVYKGAQGGNVYGTPVSVDLEILPE